MSLLINNNIASLIAQNNLTKNTSALQQSFTRLSSGLRISNASDDAAGLEISQNLQAQINGVNQASSNAQDGVNILQVADGALSVIQSNLQRIRELTVQAANDTNGSSERTAIAQEIAARLSDITRIANSTKFNGVSLIGSASPTHYYLQIGANATSSTEQLDVGSAMGTATASALHISTLNVSSASAALSTLSQVDAALTIIATKRSTVGSFQNRLQSAISNLTTESTNFTAAQSRIADVDVAAETANLTRAQILQQASVSVLAQANQSPQLALKLLG